VSAPLLRFPQSRGREIPTPVYYQPGDVYDILEIHDDSLLCAGFVRGCVFYVKVGHTFPGVPHLCLWHGGERLGYVTESGRECFNWLSFGPTMPSGTYPHDEAEIVGAVTEVWSFGIGPGKPRWVYDEHSSLWSTNAHLPTLLKAIR